MAEVGNVQIKADARQVDRANRSLDALAKTASAVGTKLGQYGLAADKAAKDSKKFGDQTQAVSNKVRQLTTLIGGLGLSFGALATIRQATSTMIDFRQSMSAVQAITGATAAEMKALEQSAREMGARTRFSAQQASEAFQFLGMAGMSVQQSIAAIPEVLSLASAASLDLGTSADIVTNIMSPFGIAAADTARVVDALAGVATNANTNVLELGEAMKFAAPIAAAAGVSIEDTAIALGVLADDGIKATLGGTALRRVLLRMVNPTNQAKKAIEALGLSLDDLDPSDLVGSLRNLADANLDLQSAAQIFGAQGAGVVITLTNAIDDLELKTAGAQERFAGLASGMAAIRADNLAGDITALQSAISELFLTIMDDDVDQFLRNVTQAVTEIVRAFAGMEEEIKLAIKIIGTLIAMNLVGWAARGAVALGQMVIAMRTTATAATVLNRSMMLLGGPAGIVFGVATATVMLSGRFNESTRSAIEYAGGIDALRQKFDELGDSQRELMRLELTDELRRETQRFAELQRQIDAAAGSAFNLSLQGGGIDPITGQNLADLNRQMTELNAEAEQVSGNIEQLEQFLRDTAETTQELGQETSRTTTIIDDLEESTVGLTDAERELMRVRDQVTRMMQESYQEFRNQEALTAALRESEEAYRQLSNEQRINAIVQEQVNALTAAGAEDIGKQTEAIRANLVATQQQLDAQLRIREQRTREQQIASDLDALRVSLQQISPAAQEYAESIQTITQAFETGAIATQAEFDAILGQLKDRFTEATAQADPFEKAWGSAMSSLEGAFTDFLMNGLDDFDSFADAVMGITKRLVAEIITEFAKAQIGKALGNVIGGGAPGGGSIGGDIFGSIAGEGLKNLFGFGASAAPSMATIGAAPFGTMGATSALSLSGASVLPTTIAPVAAASGGALGGLAAAAGPIALGIGAFALLGGLFGGSKKRQQERAQRDQILAREEELKVQLASIDGLEDLTLQRERELEKLSPANREIQERVYALEDEIRITRERRALEERAFRLIGDTASLRRRELAQTEEANRGILRYIYAVEDAQERVAAAQDKVSQAEQRVTRAFDAVRRAVEAQEAGLLDQRREIEDRQRELDQQFTTRIDLLDSALDRMRSNLGSAMSPFAERAMAKAVLDVVLASGINAVDEDTLRQALDVVASPSENLFATFQDYAREFVKTQNTLQAIKADAEQSLSVEERIAAEQLAKIDQQIDLGRQQLEAAQRQVDAAFGIDNSVKSVEEAMRGLTASIGGLASARGSLSSAESSLASLISRGPPAAAPPAAAPAGPSGPDVGKLQAAGQLAARGPLALGEENTWRSTELRQLRDAGINLQSRDYASRSQIQALRDKVTAAGGTPAFADGGMHMGGMRIVGERGPELEATGPSRILSNRDLMSAIGGGGSAESMEAIRSEIRGLRSELARTQYKIERNTRRTSDTLTIWDADGLPAERT